MGFCNTWLTIQHPLPGVICVAWPEPAWLVSVPLCTQCLQHWGTVASVCATCWVITWYNHLAWCKLTIRLLPDSNYWLSDIYGFIRNATACSRLTSKSNPSQVFMWTKLHPNQINRSRYLTFFVSVWFRIIMWDNKDNRTFSQLFILFEQAVIKGVRTGLT